MSRLDERIRETRQAVAIRAKYMCEVCTKQLWLEQGELAHRIPQRRHLVAKYGVGVIHHTDNLRWTHRGNCNDAVSIGGKPVACEELAKEIQLRILEDAGVRMMLTPHLYVKDFDRLARVAEGEE